MAEGDDAATEVPAPSGLQRLSEAAGAVDGQTGAAPVDSWDPPYCGAIGMAIRRDGTWTYRGSPIGRQRLVRLFARILRKDADGRTYLVTPVEKVDCEVEDAPFLAVDMVADGRGEDQILTVRTNLDDVVTIGPAHPLRFAIKAAGGGLKPYVRVRGRLDALLTRAVYFDLVQLATIKPDGTLGVWSGGQWFAFPSN